MSSTPHNPFYPSAGEVIDGKYQIERMLGEGGMGAVAKATHLLRRAPVALKFMSPNVLAYPGAVERFLNEGVAASQIDSDHVVHIFDVGKLPGGSPYLVMEYMEGQDLSELIAREGRPGLELARSIHFTEQMLRGLQVAHDAGIIHRDMKPSNAFVMHKEGEDDFVKLLDFGISKVKQGNERAASLTQTNSALGTPLYMSPEQAKSPRDVDLRSDLYSVAVILYELLSGRTPFNSESGEFTEILFKLFTAEPPDIRSFRPDVSAGLAAALHRGLARDPNDRYPSAAAFGIALEPWADSRSARVIHRLKTHTPGRKAAYSSAPPGAGPAAAFSQLSSGAASRVAVASTPQPATPSIPPPPRAPSRPSYPERHSAFPPEIGHRASSAEEAVAPTQYHHTPSGPPPAMAPLTPSAPPGAPRLTTPSEGPARGALPPIPAAARTDLGATRDVPVATKKRPVLAFAAAGFVTLALAATGAWRLVRSSGPSAPVVGATADPDLASPRPPTASPSAAPAPTTSAPLAAPSASPLPEAPVVATPPRPHAPGVPSAAPSSSARPTKRLKDLKAVE